MEATVRELLATTQADRKAKLDAGRVDTVFKVGDRVLLRTKELLDAANIGKPRPRWPGWDGPFTPPLGSRPPEPQRLHSCPAYTLAPQRWAAAHASHAPIVSNPSLSVPGARRPGPRTGGRARGRAAAQPPQAVQGHGCAGSLPGALAGPHVRRRRGAVRGGAA